MVVRLTHRAAPAQQHYTIPALTGSFSLTGVSTMFRAARKMDVPDKIPYLLTGQPVALSKKPPVWSAAPSYSITAGVASGPTAIPVSVPGGGSPIITVTWSATGTPSTKPSWVTLNSGTSPTIQFTGAQTDSDDISGMVLSAVANGQSAVLSQPGTIVVNSSSAGSWRSLTLSSNISPFEGSLEHGFGGNKHIALTWHPLQERVFNGGGDYGYGANYTYTQGAVTNNMGASTWITFAPTGARTHSTPFGLRGDHYSLDPLSTSTWRFEHPHMPTNVGGSPENRPTYIDMIGFPWDPVEQGFWIMEHTIRDDQTVQDSPKYTNASGFWTDPGGYPGGDMDEWANSNVFEATGTGTKWEITGTYLWTPNPSIGPNLRGTYTRKFDDYAWGSYAQPTHNTPVYSASGSGQVLRVNGGGPGHGYLCKWAYYAATDQFVGVFGARDSVLIMLIFSPRALPASGKRYEYRMLSTTGWQHLISQAAYTDILNDYLYTPVETGSNAGVRKSSIHWLHLPTALAAAQGATLSMGSAWGFVDSPFTFRPDAQWENTGSSDAAASNVGLVVVNEKVVVCGGYYDLVSGNVTRVAYSSDPRAGSWTFVDSFPGSPGNLCARSWCAISKTGEVMFLPASLGGTTQSPANVIWFCSIPAAQTPLEQLASTMSAGTWAELVTNNFVNRLLPNENKQGRYPAGGGNIIEYTDKFIRDDASKKFFFIGCSRGDGSDPSYQCAGTDDNHAGHIQYDEVTNTWSDVVETMDGSLSPHAYQHYAIDPQTGDQFYIEGGYTTPPRNLFHRDSSTGTWTAEPYPGSATQTGSLQWFPEMDSLVFIDGGEGFQARAWLRARGSTTWTSILINEPIGRYSVFGRYSEKHGCIYFGGGSGVPYQGGSTGAKTLCKLTAAGQIVRLADFPYSGTNLGCSGGDTTECRTFIDPVSGNLIILSGPFAGSNVYSFNGTAWAQHGTHPLGDAYGSMMNIFCEQPDAGVVMAVNWHGNTGSKVYLYKHNGTQALTGLDWNGTGTTRRAVKFNSPPPAYPMTVIWKIYQRANTTGGTRYYTTYFWGIDGDFTGGSHKYHGAHPYPQPSNTSSTAKWEVSTYSTDFMTRGTTTESSGASAPFVTNNQWYSQAMVVSSSGSTFNHKFYIALPSVAAADFIEPNLTGISPADPSNPCFVWGQAPMNSAGNASWGGYERYEETNGIIRGMMIFTTAISQTHILALQALDHDQDVLDYCTANGITSLWYLCMNPQPTDIADRSGNGNHPVWEGSGRPTLWTN